MAFERRPDYGEFKDGRQLVAQCERLGRTPASHGATAHSARRNSRWLPGRLRKTPGVHRGSLSLCAGPGRRAAPGPSPARQGAGGRRRSPISRRRCRRAWTSRHEGVQVRPVGGGTRCRDNAFTTADGPTTSPPTSRSGWTWPRTWASATYSPSETQADHGRTPEGSGRLGPTVLRGISLSFERTTGAAEPAAGPAGDAAFPNTLDR